MPQRCFARETDAVAFLTSAATMYVEDAEDMRHTSGVLGGRSGSYAMSGAMIS